MANDVVNTYSDSLFEVYNRPNGLCTKGSQNGWPYCETDTGVRIFQEAARPYTSGTDPLTSSAPSRRRQPRAEWLQTVRVVCVGALALIGCVLFLAWQAHRLAQANLGFSRPDPEIAKTWRETAQQLVYSLLAEVRILNTNQAALGASQAQIGGGLARIGNSNEQLAGLASTQVSATRSLAAAQTELVQQTTNLITSLRQTVQQQLAQAISQNHADTAKLQSQIAEVAAGHKALLERFSSSTNSPNLALALHGVKTKTLGNSLLVTFDEGLFRHGTHFKRDAEARLQAVAKALAQASPPLRIEVIGCADDDRFFKSWTAQFEESLALQRASTVMDCFLKLGLFGPKRLAAFSSVATSRPFPSDTAQNRARNRTVVLRVSPEEARFLELAGQPIPWNR